MNMATNSLYPGFVKLFYTGGGRPHVQILPVLPAGSGSSATLTKNDGTTYADFATAIAAWTVLLKVGLNTADGISRAELWTMSSPTADPVFQTADDTAVAGTSATAAQSFVQFCLTHRTSLGGIHKLFVMEGIQLSTIRDVAPLVGGSQGAIFSAWMIGTSGWIRGRDGGILVSPIALTTKVNDALRRRFIW